MSRAVLERHQVCLRPDQVPVALKRADREHRLHEHDDQVLISDAFGRRDRLGLSYSDGSVTLFDANTAAVDGINHCLIDINDSNFIIQGQIAAEKRSHCTCA